MPWSARFDDPIPIPGRKPLRTLRDEAKFLMGLSRVERIQPHWLDAIEAVILVVERKGTGRSWIARHGRETAQTVRKPNSRRGNIS